LNKSLRRKILEYLDSINRCLKFSYRRKAVMKVSSFNRAQYRLEESLLGIERKGPETDIQMRNEQKNNE